MVIINRITVWHANLFVSGLHINYASWKSRKTAHSYWHFFYFHFFFLKLEREKGTPLSCQRLLICFYGFLCWILWLHKTSKDQLTDEENSNPSHSHIIFQGYMTASHCYLRYSMIHSFIFLIVSVFTWRVIWHVC